MTFDPDGQPGPFLNATRRAERDLAEMLGLAKGVLFDRVVTDEESLALLKWAEDHPDVVSAWPGRVLLKRLRAVFEDGVVSDEERADLQELLQAIVGGEAGMIGGETVASTLPLDNPRPLVEVPDRVFVLTGRFAMGPRDACEEQIRRVGGWPEPNVTTRTDFLVVGTFASRDWAQTSFGRKIQKAVRYRGKYGQPAIISEDHWAANL